jgi:SAM-dependent methyltransferase
MNAATETVAQPDEWGRHWDRYAASAERNPAQHYRRKLILSMLCATGSEFARNPLPAGVPPERVLDIGSGQGDFAADVTVVFPGAKLLGLELSASGVAAARRKVPGAEFVQWDFLAERQPPAGRRNWATHAVCAEVLEHLDEPERLLANASPWLAPGCRLVVTVPGGPMSQFDRHIGHRKHYRPEELRALLERTGFRVESAHGAGFPFFNLYRRVVIARGSKLIGDVAGEPSLAARMAMRGFDELFRWNLSTRGWQTVAAAWKLG